MSNRQMYLERIARFAPKDSEFLFRGDSLRVNGVNVEQSLVLPHHARNHVTSIKVAVPGSTKTYPMRKDGTHNYAAIAEHLVVCADACAEYQTVQEQKKVNEQIASDLIDEIGAPRYTDSIKIEPTLSKDRPIYLNINVSKVCSVEQAREIYNLLKSNKLI